MMHTLWRTSRFLSAFVLVFLIAAPLYAADGTLSNPLKPGLDSVEKFIVGVLQALVVIALPILALFIVYSGFLFIAARGNEAKLTDAKRNFMYVIIGALLILGAWIIATLIAGTVKQVVG